MALRAAPVTQGILALWNDCRSGDEAVYEDWYIGEHLIERVSVPGFQTGQRYISETSHPRYFTYYEVDDPAVLASPAYLARLDAPTPLTTRVMSGTFINMTRTVCRRAIAAGSIRGGHVAVTRFYETAPTRRLIEFAPTLLQHSGATRSEVWLADQPYRARLSREEILRGSDRVITACVVVHTATRLDAKAVAGRLQDIFADTGAVTEFYQLMNRLDRKDLSLPEQPGDTP